MYTHGDISPDFTSAPTAVSVSEAVLRSAPEELRPRMLRLLLERLPVGKKDVSAAHIEALLTLREGGMLDLPEGVTAWREKDVLHLEMTPPLPLPLTLSEGEQVWGDYLVRVWRSEKNTPPPARRRAVQNGPVFGPYPDAFGRWENVRMDTPLSAKGRRSDPAGGQRPPQRQAPADGAGDAAPADGEPPRWCV